MKTFRITTVYKDGFIEDDEVCSQTESRAMSLHSASIKKHQKLKTNITGIYTTEKDFLIGIVYDENGYYATLYAQEINEEGENK